MTTLSPMDRLEKLAAQRTARTDRLDEAVKALLGLLEQHVEIGEAVTVGFHTLRRYLRRTNVGSYKGWELEFSREDDEDYSLCDLDKELNGSGYVHGDFHARWRGPNRNQLLRFAQNAEAFVAAFVRKSETELAAVDAGLAGVATATDRAQSL